MEEKAKVEDRRLLARLVLVREESRSLLSGGVQDERIEKNKLRNLPEPEVSTEIVNCHVVLHIEPLSAQAKKNEIHFGSYGNF